MQSLHKICKANFLILKTIKDIRKSEGSATQTALYEIQGWKRLASASDHRLTARVLKKKPFPFLMGRVSRPECKHMSVLSICLLGLRIKLTRAWWHMPSPADPLASPHQALENSSGKPNLPAPTRASTHTSSLTPAALQTEERSGDSAVDTLSLSLRKKTSPVSLSRM